MNRTLAWRAATVAGAPLTETDLMGPRWMNYYRPSAEGTNATMARFEKVSFHDALALDESAFRRMFDGRYVFVGIERGLHPAGRSSADTFYHPWTGLRFGVELQATAAMDPFGGIGSAIFRWSDNWGWWWSGVWWLRCC